ncbi:MAG: hypothetical protein Ct9H90mP24_4800 [Methanobacteriota archaeon]|nr:MAG: hypothetical protein Ct9H90mP24_4800 [Euryarchaeota archaeon]
MMVELELPGNEPVEYNYASEDLIESMRTQKRQRHTHATSPTQRVARTS